MWYKVYVFLEFQAKFRNNLKKFSEFWKGFVNLDHLVFGGRPIYINYVTTSWSCNVVQSYDNYGVSSKIQELIRIRGFVNQECCMIFVLMMTFSAGGQFMWQHQHHEVAFKLFWSFQLKFKQKSSLRLHWLFCRILTSIITFWWEANICDNTIIMKLQCDTKLWHLWNFKPNSGINCN